MSKFSTEINDLYATCGEHHLLPFIGSAYKNSNHADYRVVAVGINSYISPTDWRENGEEMRPWFHKWWENAGLNNCSFPFYNIALKEAVHLALYTESAKPWSNLTFDPYASAKPFLYATNALKIYTTNNYKKSSAITPSLIQSYEHVWRAELDLMARFDCLPHLIIVFGRSIWETHWRSVHHSGSQGQSFSVRSYRPAGEPKQDVYHHANRVIIDYEQGSHTLIIACLHHPRARVQRNLRRNAEWLLAQPEYQELFTCFDP